MKFKSNITKSLYTEDNSKNENWWNQNPMTYDWDEDLGELKLTNEYFNEIDKIFGEGHSLINNPNWPRSKILEKFIPYKDFKDKEVLEIGCGAGLVSSHISISGAKLTSIDITSNAIKMTSARFKLFGLQGNILKMDGEKIEFPDNYFNFIVSWGVIHHSGNMKKILEEIWRTLKPGGKAYLMVYNKNSIRYQVYCRFWLGIMKLKYLKYSHSDIVGSITDGHIARHLTKYELTEMTKKFSKSSYSFSDEKPTIVVVLP